MTEDSSKTYVPPPSAGSSGMKSPQSQRNEAMQSKYKQSPEITTTDKDSPRTPSRLSPGMIGGKQVVQSAHTDLDDPVSSPHLNSPVNPFIHYRPASDIKQNESIPVLQNDVSSQNVELIDAGSKLSRLQAQDHLARQRLDKAPIQNGEFVGSESEYNQYTADYQKHLNISNKLNTGVTEYNAMVVDQQLDMDKLDALETQKERAKFGGLRGVSKDISEKLPTFDGIVNTTVEQVEKSPALTKTFLGFHKITHLTPAQSVYTDSIGELGEGIYTYGQEHPLGTLGFVGAGLIAGPVVGGVSTIAAGGLGAGVGAGILPASAGVSAAAIGTSINYAFLAGLGVSEYKHITAPVKTGETGTLDMPTYRDPTVPEMAGRLGQSLVPISAMAIGASIPKAISKAPSTAPSNEQLAYQKVTPQDAFSDAFMPKAYPKVSPQDAFVSAFSKKSTTPKVESIESLAFSDTFVPKAYPKVSPQDAFVSAFSKKSTTPKVESIESLAFTDAFMPKAYPKVSPQDAFVSTFNSKRPTNVRVVNLETDLIHSSSPKQLNPKYSQSLKTEQTKKAGSSGEVEVMTESGLIQTMRLKQPKQSSVQTPENVRTVNLETDLIHSSSPKQLNPTYSQSLKTEQLGKVSGKQLPSLIPIHSGQLMQGQTLRGFQMQSHKPILDMATAMMQEVGHSQTSRQRQRQRSTATGKTKTLLRARAVEMPEIKILVIPDISINKKSRSKSKRSQDPLDLLDKNLYNKYNDPLKVGASIDANVKKLLGGL